MNKVDHENGGGHEKMSCNMNMVWNTNPQGICIVFSSWQINGFHSLVFSLATLFALSALLEYLRYRIRKYDANFISKNRLNGTSLTRGDQHRRKASVQTIKGHPALTSIVIGERRVSPSGNLRAEDDAPLLPGGVSNYSRNSTILQRLYHAFIPILPIAQIGQFKRSILYLITLALSMFLMLVFMTYNAQLIIAVLGGATFGHYLFNRDFSLGLLSDEKPLCH